MTQGNDLPPVIDQHTAPEAFLGRIITSKHDWTISEMGGVIPIEPPIHAPAGAHIIAGGVLVGVGPFMHRTEIAAYVDGRRTHHYRFTDGRFMPTMPTIDYDDGGLPVHLPIIVNHRGEGPCDDGDPDAFRVVCWCSGPACLGKGQWPKQKGPTK